MVNKVITFSNEEPAKSKLMVYADLNLTATPAPIVKMPTKSFKGQIVYLGLQDADSDPDDLLIGDTTHDRFLIVNGQMVDNKRNVDYNRELSNKAHFKLEKNINVNAIKQSIKNIFSWMPGERIINPEFGSKLRSYLYQGITAYNVEAIMAEVQRCFSVWEPRANLVSVRDISSIEDTDDNTVQIEIIYTIPSLSPEQYSYTIEVQKTV